MRALALILVIAACGNNKAPAGTGSAGPIKLEGSSANGSAGGFGSATFGDRTAIEPGSDDPQPSRVKPEEPEPAPSAGSNDAKAIFELGAIPAWQVVIDRTHYLARRGQHGVAYGVVGGTVMVPPPPPPIGFGSGAGSGSAGSGSGSPIVRSTALVATGYVWLIDDTEGSGALAIRVQLPTGKDPPRPGERVALGGAWILDDDHRWVWKVDAVSLLPPAPAQTPPAPVELAPPGHTIIVAEHVPAGSHTISVAKEGDVAYFQLVGGAPAVDGDGWAVADELGNPTYALINLPGERPTYGAQDMRAPDERWALRRGVTYVVKLGHIRKHGVDKPAAINARTAPILVR